MDACSENPLLVGQVIDAATEGVKLFADNQQEKASLYLNILTDVLDNTDGWKSRLFTRRQVLETLLATYDGTPHGEKLKKQIQAL